LEEEVIEVVGSDKESWMRALEAKIRVVEVVDGS